MNKVYLTIYCQGGLGNQLFQFALGYILAKRNKINLRINIESFNSSAREFDLDKFPEINKLNILKIKKQNFFIKIHLYLQYKFQKILKITGIYKLKKNSFSLKKKLEKSPFIFNKNLLKNKINKNFLLSGFFQSEKYFINYRKIILKLLKFPKIKNKSFQSYLDLIKNRNSVAIHIRRGDYFNNLKVRYFHGIIGEDYYKKSIDYIKRKIKKPFFFIFSDDINLVKKNFFF